MPVSSYVSVHHPMCLCLTLCVGVSGGNSIASDGKNTGLFLMGSIINFCTMLTVNYKVIDTYYRAGCLCYVVRGLGPVCCSVVCCGVLECGVL